MSHGVESRLPPLMIVTSTPKLTVAVFLEVEHYQECRYRIEVPLGRNTRTSSGTTLDQEAGHEADTVLLEGLGADHEAETPFLEHRGRMTWI